MDFLWRRHFPIPGFGKRRDDPNSFAMAKTVRLPQLAELNVLAQSGLLSIYPTPLTSSNNAFTVAYSTPQEGAVEIKVVNMYGETVASLAAAFRAPVRIR